MRKHHVVPVIVVAAALALALLAMPSSASATIFGNLDGGDTAGYIMNNNFPYAAGIVMTDGNYTFSSFSAKVNVPAGTQINVSIYDATGPGGTPGASSLYNLGSQGGTGAVTLYTFSAFGVTLTQNVTYWFVMTVDTGSIVDWRQNSTGTAPSGAWWVGYAKNPNLAGWQITTTDFKAAFEVNASLVGSGGSTPGGSAPVPPDDRINWQHGDAYAVFFARYDEHGEPVLHTYCISEDGKGSLELIVTQDMLDKYPEFPDKPTQNRELFHSSVCRTPFFFYILTTGEYQINVGPDWEGKTEVIIFTGMPPGNVYFYSYDVFHPIQWQ